MEPYQPVDCSLHDRYEAAAVRRSPVTVVVKTPDGPVQRSGVITDILVAGGAEYLVLDGETRIRLDHIESSSVTNG